MMEVLSPPTESLFSHTRHYSSPFEYGSPRMSRDEFVAEPYRDFAHNHFRSPSRGRTRDRRHLPPVLTLSIAHRIDSPIPQRSTFSPSPSPIPSAEGLDDELIFPMSPVIGQTKANPSSDSNLDTDSNVLNGAKSLSTIWNGYDRFNSRGRPRTRRGRRRSSVTANGKSDCVTSPVGIPIRNHDPITKNATFYDPKYLSERENVPYGRIQNAHNNINYLSPSTPDAPFMYSFPIFESSFLEKAGHWRARKPNVIKKSDSKKSLLTAQLHQFGVSHTSSTDKDASCQLEAFHDETLDNVDMSLSKAFQSVSLDDEKEQEGFSKSTSAFHLDVFPFPRHGLNNFDAAMSPSILSSLSILPRKTTAQPKTLAEQTDGDHPLQSFHVEEDLFNEGSVKAGLRSKVINIDRADCKISQEPECDRSCYFSAL